MPNIKPLNDSNLHFFIQKYIFEIKDNKIIVTFKNRNRITTHDMDKSFFIFNKTLKRKISFSLEAINIWKELYNEYNLIYIQHAVNILKLTYRKVNTKNVLEVIHSSIRVEKI